MSNNQIGPYTIQSHLGRGGMSDVYLAWDTVNRWPVALKVLRAAPDKQAKLQKRSEREAALLTRLRHKQIVQVYDAGRSPEGHYYIAMEYVSGGDLDDLIRHKPGAKMPVAEAVYLMWRVAGAMEYAHGQGVVHRDLKPANILLRGDTGEPVITDLGIAAFAGANRLTGTMESLGTPQYMAPEQAQGQGTADARADVYAIGAMLYELLTGRLPFEAENNWAILLRKQQEDAPPVAAARRDVDPRLAAVVDTCLRRDPAQRYPTAGALAAALAALLPANAHPPAPLPAKKHKAPTATPSNPGGGRPSTGGSTGGRATGGQTKKQRSPALLLAVVGALALVVVLALVLSSLREPTSAQSPGGGGADTADRTERAEPTADETTADGRSTKPTSTAAAPVQLVAGGDTGAAEADAASAGTPTATTTRRATPTRRPTTQETTVRITRNVYTRSGPGLDYPQAGGGLAGGEVVTVLGRDTSRNWYLVESPTGDVWVSEGYATLVNGSLSGVPEVSAPPRPTLTPTPTAVPPTATATARPADPEPQPTRPTATPEKDGGPTVEPPPLDSDGDGVPDDDDFCPTNPAGPNPDPVWPGCPAPDSYPYP